MSESDPAASTDLDTATNPNNQVPMLSFHRGRATPKARTKPVKRTFLVARDFDKLAGACVFEVCRQSGQHMPYKKIAQALSMDMHKLKAYVATSINDKPTACRSLPAPRGLT